MDKVSRSGCFSHISALAALAAPMIFNALIEDSQNLVTMMFVGRLSGASYLGAAVLGNMLCNITGYSLAFGMCAALDTLIAQAYGAKAYALMGLHSQRAMVILTLFSIPIAGVWWSSEYILRYVLGIDSVVSSLAGFWSRRILIGLWPSLMFQILRKHLQGAGIVWPALMANIISMISNIAACYVLVPLWGFGGAAFAVALSQWIAFFSLVLQLLLLLQIHRYASRQAVYMPVQTSIDDGDAEEGGVQLQVLSPKVSCATDTSATSKLPTLSIIHLVRSSFVASFPLHTSFPPLSTDILTNWSTFLSLALPCASSLFLEWGSYELMAGLAGHLGDTALATHGVFMTTCSLFYMLPRSLADATSTIAGNFLGDGKAAEAAEVVNLGLWSGLGWGLGAATLLLTVLRESWASVFTTDAAVAEMVYTNLPIMFVYIVVDSTKCLALNTLRSTGRPTITAVGNIISCLLIMLPLGWLLGLKCGYGLIGLWGAMSAGWAAATLIFLYCLLTTDWMKQVELARARNSAHNEIM